MTWKILHKYHKYCKNTNKYSKVSKKSLQLTLVLTTVCYKTENVNNNRKNYFKNTNKIPIMLLLKINKKIYRKIEKRCCMCYDHGEHTLFNTSDIKHQYKILPNNTKNTN